MTPTTAAKRRFEQEEMIGQLLSGRYQVVGTLGAGGMSSIYEADDRTTQRRVALKVLHPGLADKPEAVARLQHEAQVVAAIQHANICKVIDVSTTDAGAPFLVMELLHGCTLAEKLVVAGALSFSQLAPYMRQILAALEAAHQSGILHRDLKPENIFLEEDPGTRKTRAVLLDFGISKSMSYDFLNNKRLTHTGMVMGTPYYMAPEQARGDSRLDQRADLWAVGVIMYEALTGRRPFVASNYNALLVKILTSRPKPLEDVLPGMDRAIVGLIDKGLSKLREDRYQSARAMAEAIADVEQTTAIQGLFDFASRQLNRSDTVPEGIPSWQDSQEMPTLIDGPASTDDTEEVAMVNFHVTTPGKGLGDFSDTEAVPMPVKARRTPPPPPLRRAAPSTPPKQSEPDAEPPPPPLRRTAPSTPPKQSEPEPDAEPPPLSFDEEDTLLYNRAKVLAGDDGKGDKS